MFSFRDPRRICPVENGLHRLYRACPFTSLLVLVRAAAGRGKETCQGTNTGCDLDCYANRRRLDDGRHGAGAVRLTGFEILAAAQ